MEGWELVPNEKALLKIEKLSNQWTIFALNHHKLIAMMGFVLDGKRHKWNFYFYFWIIGIVVIESS